PSTKGNRGLRPGYHPARISASHGPTPAVSSAIRTSPGSTLGTGKVCIERRSGPPKRSMAAASISVGMAEARLLPASARERGRSSMLASCVSQFLGLAQTLGPEPRVRPQRTQRQIRDGLCNLALVDADSPRAAVPEDPHRALLTLRRAHADPQD